MVEYLVVGAVRCIVFESQPLGLHIELEASLLFWVQLRAIVLCVQWALGSGVCVIKNSIPKRMWNWTVN